MSKLKHLFGNITKTEDQADGSVKVWGFASSGIEDAQGEIVTPDAMKAALPDYMKFANVREMHQAKAAGICIDAEVQDDGRTFFGAHVIDKEAAEKVRKGVYKGFSIGGRVTKRHEVNKGTITALTLSEVSLVDRPANPEAVFTVFKVDAMKGMGHVAQLASVLQSFQYMVADQQAEAARENDGSPVPGKLKDVADQLAAILVQMTQEETAELIANITPDDGSSPLADDAFMSAGLHGLSKKGAKFSAATKTKLGAAHMAMKSAVAHLDSLAYSTDSPVEHKDAADLGDLTKLDELAAANDALVKSQDLIKALVSERDTAVREIARMRALPAPTKGVLRTVSKSDDIGGRNVETPKTAEEMLKAIHATGGSLVNFRNPL